MSSVGCIRASTPSGRGRFPVRLNRPFTPPWVLADGISRADTMMKFASFEKTVELIYDTLPGRKADYSKLAQTGISFTGGYIAGILCAIVSHPADVCLPPHPTQLD